MKIKQMWVLSKDDPGVQELAEKALNSSDPLKTAFELVKSSVGSEPYVYAAVVNAMAQRGLPYLAAVARKGDRAWVEVYNLENKSWDIVDLDADFGSFGSDIVKLLSKAKFVIDPKQETEEESKRSLGSVLLVSIGLPILGSYIAGTLPEDLSKWREPQFRTIVTSIVMGTLVGIILR